MAKASQVVKFVGPAGWCSLADAYHGRVIRGILSGANKLALSVECHGRLYGMELIRGSGDRFDGRWTRQVGPKSVTGVVTAVIYTSTEGKLLFGTWVEDETRYQWWTEMSVVAHFPDEGKK